jgi:hypothetical protein
MTNPHSSWRTGAVARAGLFIVVPLAVVGVLALGASAPAEAAAKRRVGVSISGSPSAPMREAISDALKKHQFEVTGADLSGDSEDAIASAARAGKLSAVIVGEVKDAGKRLKLRVYGASGDLIGEGSWNEKGGAKKLAASVERTLWARVGGALSKTRPPAAEKGAKPEPVVEERDVKEAKEPEEAPTYSRSKDADEEAAEEDGPRSKRSKKKKEKEEEEEAASEAGGPASPAAGPALELEVGPRFVGRSLSWQQASGPNALNPYKLNYAPAIGGRLAWYPAAHFTGGWISNIGIAFAAEYVPGVTSQTDDGSKYPTQLSDYNGGLRGRLVYGPVRGALTIGGGQHAMIFRNGTTTMGTLAPRGNLIGTPDVKYVYARIGADVAIVLPSHFSAALGGGYRYVLSAGDVNYLLETGMYLPNAKIAAFDLGASVGYQFLPMLGARLGFDLRYYQITAGTNTHMVTSGTDQYTAFWGAVVVTLDGPSGQAK